MELAVTTDDDDPPSAAMEDADLSGILDMSLPYSPANFSAAVLTF